MAELYNIPQVAKLLGKSRQYIWDCINALESKKCYIKAIKVGRFWVVEEAEIERIKNKEAKK